MCSLQQNLFDCEAASFLNDRDGAAKGHIKTKWKVKCIHLKNNYIFKNAIFLKENGFVVIDLWSTWAEYLVLQV